VVKHFLMDVELQTCFKPGTSCRYNYEDWGMFVWIWCNDMLTEYFYPSKGELEQSLNTDLGKQ